MLRTAARPVGAAAALAAAAVLALAAVPDPAGARSPARTTTVTTCRGADVKPQVTEATVARQALLCLLNWERAGAGQPPVVLDERLSAAAQTHSDDMVARNYFAHDAPPPAPTRFDERIAAAGYAWATAGENIAVGLATPRAVITAWLGSQSHCQSVLSPSFTAVGFGVNVGGTGKFFGPTWTQTLGRTQAEPNPGGNQSTCPTTPTQPAPYDPLVRWHGNQNFGSNGKQNKGSGQGGLGDPTTVVATPPPPPVAVPPVATPPAPVLTIAKLRRSKRTLRLDLTLPATSAKASSKKKKTTSSKKSSGSKKTTKKATKASSKKATSSGSAAKKQQAKARSRVLPAKAGVRAMTKKTAKKATKKTTKKKTPATKTQEKKTTKKKSRQMTVTLRVIQKGQKARNFRFRRTAGRTYRLRIQLRQPKHGALRVQVAGHKAHARFK